MWSTTQKSRLEEPVAEETKENTTKKSSISIQPVFYQRKPQLHDWTWNWNFFTPVVGKNWTTAHLGLVLRRSMEEARDVWNLLEEQVLPGPPRGVEETPGCAPPAPPPMVWWAWRDLGRLAKRPSAIILSSEGEKESGLKYAHAHMHCIYFRFILLTVVKNAQRKVWSSLSCNLTCLLLSIRCNARRERKCDPQHVW